MNPDAQVNLTPIVGVNPRRFPLPDPQSPPNAWTDHEHFNGLISGGDVTLMVVGRFDLERPIGTHEREPSFLGSTGGLVPNRSKII